MKLVKQLSSKIKSGKGPRSSKELAPSQSFDTPSIRPTGQVFSAELGGEAAALAAIDSAKLAATLKECVGALEASPHLLSEPEFGFFRDYIESLPPYMRPGRESVELGSVHIDDFPRALSVRTETDSARAPAADCKDMLPQHPAATVPPAKVAIVVPGEEPIDAVRDVLTKLDDNLVEALADGVIRFVRTEWLLQQPADFRMVRRQALEQLERHFAVDSPLLQPAEAVALVRQGARSVAVLSYGWLTPADPDPAGKRVAAVKHALQACPHLKAVFWEYANVP